MTQRIQRRNPSRIQLPLWIVVGLLLTGLLVIGGSGFWLFQTIQNQVANFSVTNEEFVPQETDNLEDVVAGEDGKMPAPPVTTGILPLISTDAIKPWSGHDRVSILLLGIDQRCDDDGPTRTDSMMVLTIDPVGLSAAAISLPRDLWVQIPGFDVNRINQAHYLGEIYEYPGGGPTLALKTVESALGIELDYYFTINFDGFVQFINHIDSIQVEVPEEIDDPTYPDSCFGYDPFQIEPGLQNMNGQIALQYARTRATEGGDVDRAARQQQVLLAVRDKVLKFDMLPKLMLESPQLWQTFQDNVQTSMSLDEALQLALLVQDIPRESITAHVINFEYVYADTTADGQQVLIPIRDNIRQLRDQIFTLPAVPTPVIDDLTNLVAQEEAKVRVINGTQTFGLAAATQLYLVEHDVDVTEIGNADASTYRTTQIIDYSNKNYTSLYLTHLLSLPPLNISAGTDPHGDYDILVVLGSDWQLADE